MTDQKIDRRKLTFSQAQGIDPLPQSAALGELPQKARNGLWNLIYTILNKHIVWGKYSGYSQIAAPWNKILCDYHVSVLHKPADEFSSRRETQVGVIKKLFLKGAYNRIFDFLQFLMRHDLVGNRFREEVVEILEEHLCAYTVIDDEVPTIVPIAMPEQRDSIEAAFTVLQPGPFDGAREHLRKSVQCINDNDPAGSVRESIHAVESVARRLNSGAATTLQPALTALSKNNVALHPAFKGGIEKLYAYTSDEGGIRHALVGDANVDTTDAIFMFGACASFCAYLVQKARKAGLPIDE